MIVPALLSSGCDKGRDMLGKVIGSEKPPAGDDGAVREPLVTDLKFGEVGTFGRRRGLVMVLCFRAEWSGPCLQLDPLLEKIAAESRGVVRIGRVDIEKVPEVRKSHEVGDVPDVRIYRDGRLVDRFVGLPREELVVNKIRSQTAGLEPPAPGESADRARPTFRPMEEEWTPPGMRKREFTRPAG